MLFRIQEACQYLAVSRSTLYRLINAGEIRPIYINGAPRISKTNINSLVGEIDG
ncbi:helix-turn-helix domain-containing protein [Aquiluna sp.]|nr:helix-turn-helix domain-containing protein [Aquiluna sp.]MDA8992673.1 helix-turn-helix domain-containing protein [Aquiluna sp.]